MNESLPFCIINHIMREIKSTMITFQSNYFSIYFSEHFCDPSDKSHPKFSKVADTVMTLYSACNQMDGQPAQQFKIGDVVKQGKLNILN